MLAPSSQPVIRATLLADERAEDDAVCHQNIADDLSGLIAATMSHWRHNPAALILTEPAPGLLFASLADVLAELLEGLSSGYLQALYAARKARS